MQPVVAYHFTTESHADLIRAQGFLPSDEMFGSSFVWLTRNPDDPVAGRRGPVRLTVTVNGSSWLILSGSMVRSRNARRLARLPHAAAMQALGRHDDETLNDFVRRKGYAGIWYTAAEQPWLAVLDPHAVALQD